MKSYTTKNTGDTRCVECRMYQHGVGVWYGVYGKDLYFSGGLVQKHSFKYPVCQDCFNKNYYNPADIKEDGENEK